MHKYIKNIEAYPVQIIRYITKWRNILKSKIIIASIVLGAIYIVFEFNSCGSNKYSNKCQVIYDIMKELKTDMSREEVLSIIEKHDNPYVVKSYNSSNEYVSPKEANREFISVWVHYASLHSIILCIGFHDNKLYMTKVSGENGPNIFKDAPPEIIPEKQHPAQNRN